MDIHIARNGKQFGPFPLDEVKRQLAVGELFPSDLAWTNGEKDWVPLAGFPPLMNSPSSQEPPPISPLRALDTARPIPSVVEPPQLQPRQTSGAAIASLVFGILSFSCLPLIATLFAIIFGHVALSAIRKSAGALKGEGIAIFGLVLGYLSIGALPILAGIAVPVFAEVQVKAKEKQSLSHAKQIAVASLAYASDHQGAFPPKLDDLVPTYLPDRVFFASPLTPGEPVAYYYFGGTDQAPPDTVLLMSKYKNKRGRRIIMHVDGSGLVGVPPSDVLPPAGQ
ncbi:MAG: DUF4190 domain-containing protein [Chthoniobacter sp.]|uniref:DUF4190 domain-containing protein n=1 Tax=Chthoniobacter sp. TaxID=2510640 RepID=UPI0032A28768